MAARLAGRVSCSALVPGRGVHGAAGAETAPDPARAAAQPLDLAAGLTQAELAESVRQLAMDAGAPCGPSTPSCQQVSRWENGHDKPGAFYQELLAAWYRTDPARLGLIGTLRIIAAEDHLLAPAVQEEEEVERRRFLAVAAAPVLFQLDQIRRRMDADLRRVLPAADTDLWAPTGWPP